MPSHPHELPANLIGFLRAVTSHWVSLMSGGVITAALGLYVYFSGRNVPSWVYIPILALFVFWACYLAWRDAQTGLMKLARSKLRGIRRG
jgi:uncharacterized membrane protein (UPF0136 family)